MYWFGGLRSYLVFCLVHGNFCLLDWYLYTSLVLCLLVWYFINWFDVCVDLELELFTSLIFYCILVWNYID